MLIARALIYWRTASIGATNMLEAPGDLRSINDLRPMVPQPYLNDNRDFVGKLGSREDVF